MPSYDSDALAGFDEFFGRILAGLTPAARRRASLKLGRLLLRSNLKRIAANVEPEGGRMEARKPRLDRRGRLRKNRGGKMFRRLRLAGLWRVDAQADSVEIRLKKGDRVAATHHFGEKGFVGRAPDGRPIRARYAERRLLGFSKDDEQLALDVAAELLESGR